MQCRFAVEETSKMKTKIVYVMCDYSQHIVTLVYIHKRRRRKRWKIYVVLLKGTSKHAQTPSSQLIEICMTITLHEKNSGWRARIILSYVTYYAVTKSVFFFNVSLSILLPFNPFPHYIHIHIEAFYVKLLSAKRQRQWSEEQGWMRECYSNAKVALESLNI